MLVYLLALLCLHPAEARHKNKSRNFHGPSAPVVKSNFLPVSPGVIQEKVGYVQQKYVHSRSPILKVSLARCGSTIMPMVLGELTSWVPSRAQLGVGITVQNFSDPQTLAFVRNKLMRDRELAGIVICPIQVKRRN